MTATLSGILLFYLFALVFFPRSMGISCRNLYDKFISGWNKEAGNE